MTFLNPFLLFGLFAVAVPLLIHLINLRKPKKVRFSTLTFFESLKASTLKRIKIKRLLLLFLRMAAIIMLSFALARPFLSSDFAGTASQGQPAAIGILIDNSPSMSQIDRNGPFIDQAKRIASRIIENSLIEDRILIDVTNGAPLELPALARGVAGSRLQEVNTVNKGNFIVENLQNLIYRLNQAPQQSKKLYVITDAQASQFEPFIDKDSPVGEEHSLRVVTVGEERQANAAITGMEISTELLSRDQPITVSATVQNFGNSTVRNYFLSLDYRGEMGGQHVVNLEAGEISEFSFEIIPDGDDIITGSFLLEGDELIFDNRRYFSIQIPDKQQILLVRDSGASESSFSSYISPVLDAAVFANELLEVDNVSWEQDLFNFDMNPDVVLLDGVRSIPDFIIDDLVSYLQSGGGLFFLPSANGDLQSYNRFLERLNAGRFTDIEGSYGSFNTVDRVSSFREGHPLLNDIFDKSDDEELRVNLPEIFYYYRFEPAGGTGSYRLLNTEQDEVILFEQRFGDGRLMVSAIGADPGWSNFPVKPIFAPLFYRSVLYLAADESGGLLEHTLGDEFQFHLAGSPDVVELQAGEQTIIPERRSGFRGITIYDNSRDWPPGFAELTAGDKNLVIAVNQNTMESDFTALDNQEFANISENLFESVSVQQVVGTESEIAEIMQAAAGGREVWHWFIIGGLFFLLTESFVARLFKAESIQ